MQVFTVSLYPPIEANLTRSVNLGHWGVSSDICKAEISSIISAQILDEICKKVSKLHILYDYLIYLDFFSRPYLLETKLGGIAESIYN